MLECVINVSEGRRAEILDGLARACGPELLDVHTDPDHHRAVFTIAGPQPGATEAAARRLATAAASTLTLDEHDGVHPRLGVIDVVPFVALASTPPASAIQAARNFAGWVGTELEVPAFLYDLADPEQRTLPALRRDAFGARMPDAGPAAPHPRLGAVAVGARPVLVAVNLELADDNLELARAVARELRERDGGLPGVRALGLALPSLGHAQVSMNLVDLDATGLVPALETARDRIEAAGGRVRRVELVGLVPAAVLAASSPELLAWTGLDASRTIEARVATAAGGRAAWAGAAAGARPAVDPASPA